MSNDPIPEAVTEALRSIFSVLLPEHISWKDIQHVLRSYDRKGAIDLAVNKATEDPFLKLKLYLIYSELKQLADNGGLL